MAVFTAYEHTIGSQKFSQIVQSEKLVKKSWKFFTQTMEVEIALYASIND